MFGIGFRLGRLLPLCDDEGARGWRRRLAGAALGAARLARQLRLVRARARVRLRVRVRLGLRVRFRLRLRVRVRVRVSVRLRLRLRVRVRLRLRVRAPLHLAHDDVERVALRGRPLARVCRRRGLDLR